MSKINILIVEDSFEESELLVDLLETNGYNIVGIARNFKEAITLYHSENFDLVIIDIFLNGLPEGILFAETITSIPNGMKPFVFLTSSKDRQIFERAKLTKPFSFLMKPFNQLEVLYAIEMAIEKYYDQNLMFSSVEQLVNSQDFLFIKKKCNLVKVFKSDIIFIEVEDRYCNIFTENEKFVVQISLTKMESYLGKEIFTRTHRNYLINKNKISEIDITDNLIYLQGNYKVLLSETYKGFINDFNILR
ncbi:MAG: response regulator transcription factor [Flavobacteriia bacterium]|nr:response regulator transcription factor [Flavobacteriia bacterium]